MLPVTEMTATQACQRQEDRLQLWPAEVAGQRSLVFGLTAESTDHCRWAAEQFTKHAGGYAIDPSLVFVEDSTAAAAGRAQAGTVTDEDIDAIILKGERDTEQMNKKLQEFSKDAMKFTIVRT